MIRKKVLCLVVAIGLATTLSAKPNAPLGDFYAKMKKASGEKGLFTNGQERFPKDYFLVHRNLPFLVGLSLYHQESSILNLEKSQIEELLKVQHRTVPVVVKGAQQIKKLELQLAKNIAVNSNTMQSQYYLIDEIGKLRVELTKAHLKCIKEVRDILTKEQYKKLLVYATKTNVKK